MKWPVLTLAAFSIIFAAVGQNSGPTVRVEVVSSFVWGEDAPFGAVSSTIKDPLTGYSLHRLSYGGIEVTSRVGFEGISADSTGTLISYTTTIANSTESDIPARFSGFTIDGRMVTPLNLVLPSKEDKKKTLKGKLHPADLDKMHCFTNGFLSRERAFSADNLSQIYSVRSQTAVAVSAVVRDPRDYSSVLCSAAGCYPTGTIRYGINVDGHDYVFIWPGRAAFYCGE